MSKYESIASGDALSELSPETREELDHALYDEGFSMDSLENAFEYAEDGVGELNNAINKYANSVHQDDKRDALEKIIAFIQ